MAVVVAVSVPGRFRRGRRAVRGRGRGRMDVEAIEGAPQAVEGAVAVAVEGAGARAPKGPAAAFELALAGHVGVVAVGAVPGVAVALHGQAAAHAFDDEIYAKAGDLDLREDAIAARPDGGVDVLLEQTLERGVQLVGGEDGGPGLDRLDAGVQAVVQQPIPQAAWAEIVECCRVEEPHLVAGAAGGDVEAALVAGAGQGTGANVGAALVYGRGDEAEEDDVALVA